MVNTMAYFAAASVTKKKVLKHRRQTGKTIERRTSPEMSAFGIAFLAGLYSGGLRFPDSGFDRLT